MRAAGRRYRARPRFRRRLSAGLGFRGFGAGLEPFRPPAPGSTAVAARERTGARRRASRQMNREIPIRITRAPIAIAAAVPLLRPALPDPVVVVVTIWGVVGAGAGCDDCGRPGWNGFVAGVCASAAGADTSAPGASTTAGANASTIAAPTTPSRRTNRAGAGATAGPTAAPTTRSRRIYASGCSIAGVSGAAT